MKGRVLNQKNPGKSRFKAAWVFIACIFPFSLTLAQTTSADAWINTQQTYLRLAVSQTGFYAITGQELRQAGLPIEDIPPKAIQIFRRGQELSIEVTSDDQLNNQSIISFYGERNDGVLDSSLYINPHAIPHTKYSLYSDTAVYFLTWRVDGLSGKRISESPNVNPDKDTIRFHIQETEELFTSHYNTGNFYPPGSNFNTGIAMTAYDTGEGWTGRPLQHTWQTLDLQTTGLRTDLFHQCETEIGLVGRVHGKHSLEVWTGPADNPGRKVATINLTDFEPATSIFKLNREDLAKVLLTNGKIILSAYAPTGTLSISYIKWRYPQQTNLDTYGSSKIFDFNTVHQNHCWYTGPAPNWEFYNISDPYHPKLQTLEACALSLSGATRIIGVREKRKVDATRRVYFTPSDSLKGSYLIISHPSVRTLSNGKDPVAAYAMYRASPKGGAYTVSVINVDEVFNRFNYGEPGPAGIRNLIAKLQIPGLLKFVFIIGHSVDPQTARKRSDARTLDMVPNAGWPGSDIALSMSVKGFATQPYEVPIGRINATTPDEVTLYLQKVMDLEAQPASAPWRKNILHLSGGRSYNEIDIFKNYMLSFEDKIRGTPLAPRIQTISKRTEAEVEQFSIHIPVNRGIALMTLFGHSGIDVTDIDIGYASDDTRNYRNRPFYPAVIANGCATGSIFYSQKTISSDWVFSKNRGAVLFLAHTFNGPSLALKHYSDSLYEVLGDEKFTSQPFGNIQKEAIRRNLKIHATRADVITAQQMNLHGDPAIRIFPAVLPDYAFDSTRMMYTDVNDNPLSTWSDSLKIQLAIHNHGRYENRPYTLRITDADQNLVYQSTRSGIYTADTLSIKTSNTYIKPGNFSLNLVIDPNHELPEETKENNTYVLILTVQPGGVFPLLPVTGHTTNQTLVTLTGQLAESRQNSKVIFEWDCTPTFSSSQQDTVIATHAIARYNLKFSDSNKKIFWRVYLPDHPQQRSESHTILYDPSHVYEPKLPEGVAFKMSTHPNQIQEGDTFRLEATYVNITNVPFLDSLRIKVKHITPHGTTFFDHKIPPPLPYEVVTFSSHFSSYGLVGAHTISVTFNADQSPETLFSNNVVHFTYQVIPDRLAPILTILVDDRLLNNGDVVSAEPEISIQITDENKFLIRTDTTGIEIYIRENCLDCQEKRIWLTNTKTNVIEPGIFQVRLPTLPPLDPGRYLLRIRVRDLSGNRVSEYRITFVVAAVDEPGTITVSPNPSTTYFRFLLDVPRSIPAEPLRLTIFDLFGKTVHKQTTILRSGKNELYWEPVNSPSGVYFYSIENAGGKLHLYFGGNNRLHGKLVWLQ